MKQTTKREEIEKKLKELNLLKKKEMELLEKIELSQTLQTKHINTTTQTIKNNWIKRLTTTALIITLGIWPKPWENIINTTAKNETHKEIKIEEDAKIKGKVKEEIKEEEVKNIKNIKKEEIAAIKKENYNENPKETTTKQQNTKNISWNQKKEKKIPIYNPKTTEIQEDNVFVDIYTNIEEYQHWKALSEQEKHIVKQIYNEILQTKTKAEIESILYNIQNLKIIRGLRDIIVKKIFILEKRKKDVQYFQTIAKISIKKELIIIEQITKKTENIVTNFTLEPSTYKITPIPWWHTKYLDNRQSTIQVFFTLQKEGTTIGKISFDSKGKLITKDIEWKYILSQDKNTITIR